MQKFQENMSLYLLLVKTHFGKTMDTYSESTLKALFNYLFEKLYHAYFPNNAPVFE
jgi:hypothetical protein